MTEQPKNDDPAFIAEFFEFIRERKAWWMIPIVLSVVLLALLTTLASSPLAPFIYTLF